MRYHQWEKRCNGSMEYDIILSCKSGRPYIRDMMDNMYLKTYSPRGVKYESEKECVTTVASSNPHNTNNTECSSNSVYLASGAWRRSGKRFRRQQRRYRV